MFVLCASCNDAFGDPTQCVVLLEHTRRDPCVKCFEYPRVQVYDVYDVYDDTSVVDSFVTNTLSPQESWRGRVVGESVSGTGVFVRPIAQEDSDEDFDSDSNVAPVWVSKSMVRMNWRHACCYQFPEPGSWCDVVNSEGVWREGRVMWLDSKRRVVIVRVALCSTFEHVCRSLTQDFVAPLNTQTTSWRPHLGVGSLVEMRKGLETWGLHKVEVLRRYDILLDGDCNGASELKEWSLPPRMQLSSLDLAPPGTHLSHGEELCPLTYGPLAGTCAITDAGQVYSKDALAQWLRTHDTDPVTGVRLIRKQVVSFDAGDSVALARALRDIRSCPDEFDRRLALQRDGKDAEFRAVPGAVLIRKATKKDLQQIIDACPGNIYEGSVCSICWTTKLSL